MKIITTLVLFLLASNLCFSQLQTIDRLDPSSSGFILVSSERYVKVQGSPYIIESFTSGTIGVSKQNLLFRYNNEADNIEVKFDEGKVYVLSKEENYGSVLIGKNKYVLLNYVNQKGESTYGYLIEKSKSNLSLFKRERIVISKEKLAASSYDTYEPPKFVRGDDEYYLKHKDNSIISFPKNKKRIVEMFPDQKQPIEEFIKTNKTSFSNESNIIQLVQFIDSLLVE
jgi:hypothetical protein